MGLFDLDTKNKVTFPDFWTGSRRSYFGENGYRNILEMVTLLRFYKLLSYSSSSFFTVRKHSLVD